MDIGDIAGLCLPYTAGSGASRKNRQEQKNGQH
jgi:hypothetical protein